MESPSPANRQSRIVPFSDERLRPRRFERLQPEALEYAETIAIRTGLIGHAILCWTAATRLWEAGDMIRQPGSTLLELGIFAFSFILLLLAAYNRPSRRLMWLFPAALVFVFVAYWQLDWVNSTQIGVNYRTDVQIYSDYASQLVRLGENPYLHELGDSFRVSRSVMHFDTPLLNGDFTGRAAYPALAFLLFVPFQELGISTHAIYPLFALLTFLALFLASPPIIRPLILLPLLIDPRYLLYSLGGVSDIVWAFMLLMMLITWRKRWQRAFWFGLACAFKQQPWLLAPFLVIRLWRESRGQRLKRRLALIAEAAAISAGIFLLFNLPYMLWDFPSWMAGITEPVQASMIVLGQGLSSLTMLGISFMPRSFFLLMMGLTYGIGLILYWRHDDQWREAMWILPGIALWFGQRSLSSYWYFFAIPFLFAVMQSAAQRYNWLQESDQPARNGRRSLSLAAVIPGLAIAGAVWFSHHHPDISLVNSGPVEVLGDRAVKMQVDLSNNSTATLTPRFSVQSWTDQPMFWHIERGPLQLDAGESGRYVISTDIFSNSFSLGNGAQIVATDASSFDLRGSLLIQGDIASRTYDAIPNGRFEFWDQSRQAPYLWGLIADQPDHAIQLLTPIATNNQAVTAAIQLNLSSVTALDWSSVRLDTWIPFPQGSIAVWVDPPPDANRQPFSLVYGYELVSSDHQNRVWVLFGDQEAHGQIQDGLSYWMQPAPRGVWSQQTINPQQIFHDLGLEISPPRSQVRDDLNFPMSMMNFRLLLAGRAPATVPVSAEFGPVSSDSLRPDPTPMIEQALIHPDSFLTWRGDYNLAARNFETARSYYIAALTANQQSAGAYEGIGRADAALQDWGDALNAFRIAQSLGVYSPAHLLNEQGWVYYQLGQMESAASAFQQAVDLSTGKTSADDVQALSDGYIGLGWIAQQQGDCTQALTDFQNARSALPGQSLTPDAYFPGEVWPSPGCSAPNP